MQGSCWSTASEAYRRCELHQLLQHPQQPCSHLQQDLRYETSLPTSKPTSAAKDNENEGQEAATYVDRTERNVQPPHRGLLTAMRCAQHNEGRERTEAPLW